MIPSTAAPSHTPELPVVRQGGMTWQSQHPLQENLSVAIFLLINSILLFVILWRLMISVVNSWDCCTILPSSSVKNSISLSSNDDHGTTIPSPVAPLLDVDRTIPIPTFFINLFSSNDALITTPTVSSTHKLILVTLICGNIGLFIWSDVSIIANIVGTLTIRTEKFDLGTIFNFTLGETVQDMWDAKTYLLSILLALFSGAWPFIKLVTMLYSLFAPSSMLSVEWRDWILTWMDILGKWSLLDIYFMVILLVAFEFELSLGKDIQVVLYVEPLWGFYSFLLATLLSLILGHLSLRVHRMDQERHLILFEEVGEVEAVMNHIFEMNIYQCDCPACEGEVVGEATDAASKTPFHSHIEKEIKTVSSDYHHRSFRLTPVGKISMIILILFTYVVVVLGCLRTTFSFEFRGLAGYLLQDDAKSSYSILKLGKQLPDASTTPNNSLIQWLQICYFIYTLVMPLCFLIFYLILWLIPLTLRAHKIAILWNTIILAWSSLDVFVISMMASVYEISQFAEFMIGDTCDDINKILKKYFDDELHGDDVCFDVIASLQQDAWLMYFAAFFFVVVGVMMMWICHAAYHQRLSSALHVSSKSESRSPHSSSSSFPSPSSSKLHQISISFVKRALRWLLFIKFIEEIKTLS